MKKVTGLIFVLIFLTSSGCNENKCDETTAPEINFKFLVGGTLLVEEDVNHNDVTSHFFGSDFVIHLNKIYCDQTIRGPFEEYFFVDKDGRLARIGISTWGFRMDNTEDFMQLKFFLEGTYVGQYVIPYSMLQKYDNATAYFEFRIKCEKEHDTEKVSPISVTLTN